ncbi:MAG: hypothetical protein QOG79_2385, partial [Mycobacterium sp.]|nr:hypothetical protein [Mycobacterium sp.]
SERESSVADVIQPFLFPLPAWCIRPAGQDVAVGRDDPAGVGRAWPGTPDRMLNVGYNNRHAMWHHSRTGSVTQYRRLQAFSMENYANQICKLRRRVGSGESCSSTVAATAMGAGFAPIVPAPRQSTDPRGRRIRRANHGWSAWSSSSRATSSPGQGAPPLRTALRRWRFRLTAHGDGRPRRCSAGASGRVQPARPVAGIGATHHRQSGEAGLCHRAHLTVEAWDAKWERYWRWIWK